MAREPYFVRVNSGTGWSTRRFTMRVRFASSLVVAVTLLGTLSALAADTPHGMYLPNTIKWADPPPFIPKGSKLAVLYGDPAKEGMVVLQARMPANYRIPAHSHPTDEVVTVLSGTLLVGMGDKLDPAKAKAFPAGSVIVAPAKTNHFVLTKQPAVIQVTGMGPLVFTYVNPADDPSKK
jgi:quercetin dioxygenase-like cupin family protein